MSADINKCRRLVTGMPGLKKGTFYISGIPVLKTYCVRNELAKQERAFSASSKNKMPGSIRTMEVGARPDGRLLNGPLWDKA